MTTSSSDDSHRQAETEETPTRLPRGERALKLFALSVLWAMVAFSAFVSVTELLAGRPALWMTVVPIFAALSTLMTLLVAKQWRIAA